MLFNKVWNNLFAQSILISPEPCNDMIYTLLLRILKITVFNWSHVYHKSKSPKDKVSGESIIKGPCMALL